jgi:cell division protein FtsB
LGYLHLIRRAVPGHAPVDNLAMRIATLFLLLLLGVVQAELWLGKGGLPRVWALQEQVTALQAANEQAQRRNDQLAAEVRDLKEGLDMVEERARLELGMLKPDELYVHFSHNAASSHTAPASPAVQGSATARP